MQTEPTSATRKPLEAQIDKLAEGYVIESSILSLDALDQANFNFCSSAHGLFFAPGALTPRKQTLLSQEAFDFLKWRGIPGNFLPCPYFRKVSLGSLTVELLPSGMGCGSSFLRIEKGTESLFYAKEWGFHESGALRAAQIKPADTLILEVNHDLLCLSGAAERRELMRFFDTCSKITRAGEWVIAVVPSFGPTQMVLHRLHARGIPTYVDHSGYRALTALQVEMPENEAPPWVGHTRKFSPSEAQSQPGVLLLNKESLKNVKRKHLPEGVWLWLGSDAADHSYVRPQWIDNIAFSETFSTQFKPDLSDLNQLISGVSPQRIVISGLTAASLGQALRRQGHSVIVHAPLMQTLF